jgi:hypothetical protein
MREVLMKKVLWLTAGVLIPLILLAESAPPKSGFSLKVGPAFGYLRKGFVTLPVAWTATAPSLVLDVSRSSPRFLHSLRLGFGRSSGISTTEGKRPGDNAFGWIPAEYGFTWFCCRDIFGLGRVDGGFGATLQYLRLHESIALQEGLATREEDDFFGLGPQAALRWRSRTEKWRAAARLSLSISLPFANRSVIDSDAIPRHRGGLYWARGDLVLSVDRVVGRRWIVGIKYERAAFGMLRTPERDFSLDFALSAGNYLLSHLSIQAGTSW